MKILENFKDGVLCGLVIGAVVLIISFFFKGERVSETTSPVKDIQSERVIELVDSVIDSRYYDDGCCNVDSASYIERMVLEFMAEVDDYYHEITSK